jgi:hypothetical protein
MAYTSSARLVGLNRHADERAVRQPRQRGGGPLRRGGDERRCVRRLRRDDDVPRADLLAFAPDDEGGAVRLDRLDAAGGAGACTQLAAECRRQPSRSAEQVARDQRALAAPQG